MLLGNIAASLPPAAASRFKGATDPIPSKHGSVPDRCGSVPDRWVCPRSIPRTAARDRRFGQVVDAVVLVGGRAPALRRAHTGQAAQVVVARRAAVQVALAVRDRGKVGVGVRVGVGAVGVGVVRHAEGFVQVRQLARVLMRRVDDAVAVSEAVDRTVQAMLDRRRMRRRDGAHCA
jgi:hypothetical protein